MVCSHIYSPRWSCTPYHKRRIRNLYRSSLDILLDILFVMWYYLSAYYPTSLKSVSMPVLPLCI